MKQVIIGTRVVVLDHVVEFGLTQSDGVTAGLYFLYTGAGSPTIINSESKEQAQEWMHKLINAGTSGGDKVVKLR